MIPSRSKISRNLGKRRVAVAAIGHWAIFAGIHASVLAVFIGKVSLVVSAIHGVN